MNLEELEARLRLEVGQLPYPDWVLRSVKRVKHAGTRHIPTVDMLVVCTAPRNAGGTHQVRIGYEPFHRTWSIDAHPGVAYNTLVEAVTVVELQLGDINHGQGKR